MTDLKFTLKDCDYVIKQCLQRNDVKIIDFEIIPRHKHNYIFKITFQNNDDSKKETRCLFAKTKSQSPHNILFEELKITPKFFCGKSDLLFFEDLTCQKFQNEYGTFTHKHIQEVIKVLARLHASEEIIPSEEEKFNLVDVKETEDLLWSLIDNKETVSEIVKNLEERQVSSKFRRSISHGNLTRSNILFHYNHGIPDDCKLINFKNRRYAPPIYDVLQLIFFNTEEDTRQKYFQSLLSFYWDCLKTEFDKNESSGFISQEEIELSSHHYLPLVKLETVITFHKNPQTVKELREILNESRLSREDCYTIVKNKIESTEYELLSFEIKNSLDLEVKIRHLLVDQIIKFSVKWKPKKEEIFFYDTFIPKLQEMGVGVINDCCMSSYFSRSGDIIVFDEYSEGGVDNPKKILTTLAKLHASSFIFEEKMSEKLKKPYRLDEDYDWLTRLEEVDGRFRNVLSHGNITISSNYQLINFDSIKYCPPALDLLCILKLLKNDEEKLKIAYFDELSKILSSYNYNINKFLSYQELEDSIKCLKPHLNCST